MVRTYISVVCRRWYVVLPIGITILYLVWSSWLYVSLINSPDAVSYYKIAEYYGSFQFDKAVNGYWSPLLSWLLVPAIWLRVDPAIAIAGLHIFLVMVIMVWLGRQYVQSLHLRPRASRYHWLFAIVYTAIGLVSVSQATATITPDFLAGVISLWLLFASKRLVERPSIKRGVIVGLISALLFFAKSIGFFVSVVSIVVIGLAFWRGRYNRAQYEKPLLIAVSIFASLSLGWSLLVFAKYGTFSLSTTTKNNFALIGPEANMYHQIDYSNTILPLPYDDSTTAWDDPTYIPPKQWVLGDNISYYVKHIGATALQAAYLLAVTVPLAWLGALYVYRTKRRSYLKYATVCITVTLVGLYSLLSVEERYLSIILVPLIAMAGLWVLAAEKRRQSERIAAVITSIVSIGFVAYSAVTTASSAYYMQNFRAVMKTVRQDVPQNSRVAIQSLEFISYCYYLQLQCPALNYKLVDSQDANKQHIEELQAHDIEYYIARTPAKSTNLSLVGQHTTSATKQCVIRWRLHPCGGVVVYVYKIQS